MADNGFVENREFGFSKAERIERIREAEQSSNKKTYALEYEGRMMDLPLIQLPIGCLVYRVENFRTASLQKEYCATRKSLINPDFFRLNPESIEVQKAQDSLLQKLIDDKDLLSSFEKEREKGQTEPLIVTDEGVVVNGNRRLCAWRKLLKENQTKFRSFQMITVAVLPDHDKDAVIELETQLQIKHDIKADYVWHSKAYSYISEMARIHCSSDDLDKKYNLKSGEVQSAIDEYYLAEKYLINIGRPNEWSLVDKDEFAFKRIAQSKNKKTTEQDIVNGDVFESVAFAVISENHTSSLDEGTGRLWDKIPDLAKYTDQIVEKFKTDTLKTEFEIEKKRADETGNSDLPESAIVLKVLKRADPKTIANVALRTTTTLNAIDKELKGKQAIYGFVLKAKSDLEAAVKGDKAGQSKEKVEDLLKEIESDVKSLREWLGNDEDTH